LITRAWSASYSNVVVDCVAVSAMDSGRFNELYSVVRVPSGPLVRPISLPDGSYENVPVTPPLTIALRSEVLREIDRPVGVAGCQRLKMDCNVTGIKVQAFVLHGRAGLVSC
jgi:hypothetical protein